MDKKKYLATLQLINLFSDGAYSETHPKFNRKSFKKCRECNTPLTDGYKGFYKECCKREIERVGG